MRGILLLTIAGLGLLTDASAAIIYDNGEPNLAGGNEMTRWIVADDFTLPSTTTITGVRFWTLEGSTATFQGSIYYAVYQSVGNAPNVGSPLVAFSAGANLSRTKTGNSATISGNIRDEYEYSFDITPFVATAGVMYWLGLHNGSLSQTANSSIFWETTDANATRFGLVDVAPFGDAWFDPFASQRQFAFQLTSASAGVPEPGTIALLGLGLSVISLRRLTR